MAWPVFIWVPDGKATSPEAPLTDSVSRNLCRASRQTAKSAHVLEESH